MSYLNNEPELTADVFDSIFSKEAVKPTSFKISLGYKDYHTVREATAQLTLKDWLAVANTLGVKKNVATSQWVNLCLSSDKAKFTADDWLNIAEMGGLSDEWALARWRTCRQYANTFADESNTSQLPTPTPSGMV